MLMVPNYKPKLEEPIHKLSSENRDWSWFNTKIASSREPNTETGCSKSENRVKVAFDSKSGYRHRHRSYMIAVASTTTLSIVLIFIITATNYADVESSMSNKSLILDDNGSHNMSLVFGSDVASTTDISSNTSNKSSHLNSELVSQESSHPTAAKLTSSQKNRSKWKRNYMIYLPTKGGDDQPPDLIRKIVSPMLQFTNHKEKKIYKEEEEDDDEDDDDLHYLMYEHDHDKMCENSEMNPQDDYDYYDMTLENMDKMKIWKLPSGGNGKILGNKVNMRSRFNKATNGFQNYAMRPPWIRSKSKLFSHRGPQKYGYQEKIHNRFYDRASKNLRNRRRFRSNLEGNAGHPYLNELTNYMLTDNTIDKPYNLEQFFYNKLNSNRRINKASEPKPYVKARNRATRRRNRLRFRAERFPYSSKSKIQGTRNYINLPKVGPRKRLFKRTVSVPSQYVTLGGYSKMADRKSNILNNKAHRAYNLAAQIKNRKKRNRNYLLSNDGYYSEDPEGVQKKLFHYSSLRDITNGPEASNFMNQLASNYRGPTVSREDSLNYKYQGRYNQPSIIDENTKLKEKERRTYRNTNRQDPFGRQTWRTRRHRRRLRRPSSFNNNQLWPKQDEKDYNDYEDFDYIDQRDNFQRPTVDEDDDDYDMGFRKPTWSLQDDRRDEYGSNLEKLDFIRKKNSGISSSSYNIHPDGPDYSMTTSIDRREGTVSLQNREQVAPYHIGLDLYPIRSQLKYTNQRSDDQNTQKKILLHVNLYSEPLNHRQNGFNSEISPEFSEKSSFSHRPLSFAPISVIFNDGNRNEKRIGLYGVKNDIKPIRYRNTEHGSRYHRPKNRYVYEPDEYNGGSSSFHDNNNANLNPLQLITDLMKRTENSDVYIGDGRAEFRKAVIQPNSTQKLDTNQTFETTTSSGSKKVSENEDFFEKNNNMKLNIDDGDKSEEDFDYMYLYYYDYVDPNDLEINDVEPLPTPA